MLELRPNCECCDKDLPPDSAEAMICTFECTFCCDCVNGSLDGVCPNCGGNFEPRPVRPANKLRKFPASTTRVGNTVYSVYIVRCADETYYTGIAVDVARRVAEHENSPRGAKYLKGRGPLTLVYSQSVGDRSTASRIEFRIKQLSRSGKQALIDGATNLQDLAKDPALAGFA